MTDGAAFPPVVEECGVTIMRAIKGRRATKTWTWNDRLGQWHRTDYNAGASFHATEHQVHNLAELVEVLDIARRDPGAFAVRGELAPWVREMLGHNPHRTIRRQKLKKKNGEPTLVEVARRWVMADIDKWPIPPWGDLVDDPDKVIDHAIHEL